MHVVIVGAGVMGATTAFFLQQRGCVVTVLDQQSGPAEGASHANGGFFSAGLSAPWSAPGAVGMAFKSQFDKSAAFKWKPDFTLRQVTWMLKSLKECRPERFAGNRARLTRMCIYALECLRAVEAAVEIDYERSNDGVLQLYREPVPAALVDGHLKYLETMGVPGTFLSAAQVFAMEPALARSAPGLFGALHLPGDLSGDCAVFTRKLVDAIQRKGGRFLWSTPVERVVVDESGASAGRVMAIACRGGTVIHADAYVFATGAETPRVLKGIVDVPLYPIKGYSMTAPLQDMENAPRHSMFDFATKTGMARLGNEIRVSGIAEVVGYDARLDRARCDQLSAAFEAAFPNAANRRAATFWTGLRPATPDGVPLVSRTRLGNLFINTGHGGSGWSMSCGSGKLMADIVIDGKTDIDANDYALPGVKSPHR
ncbi:D-amino acid dehydrogenase [Variovorax humicola]|uniref:D-amino acid dehydrogenase n=1 Tax=Variovorax humicola TaxID=1769758 RepID=A0ABU8W9B0_9BURK